MNNLVMPKYSDSVFENVPVKPVLQSGTGRTVIKVKDVFNHTTLKKAMSDIDTHETKENTLFGNRIERVKMNYSSNPYKPVIFDDQCNIHDWTKLEQDLCCVTPSIKQLAYEGIKRMAKTAKLKDTEVPIAVSCLRYQLTPSSPFVRKMPWHDDDCTLTMTTLISPYRCDKNLGFGGGDLSFAKKKDIKIPEYVSSHPDIFFKETIKTYPYDYNGGFIFDNINSCHRVNDIYLRNPENLTDCHVERRLFTVLARPGPDYVLGLGKQFSGENLA